MGEARGLPGVREAQWLWAEKGSDVKTESWDGPAACITSKIITGEERGGGDIQAQLVNIHNGFGNSGLGGGGAKEHKQGYGALGVGIPNLWGKR